MRRIVSLAVFAAFALAACPKDKKPADKPIAVDTIPEDLGNIKSDIPGAAPDTFTPRQPPGPVVTRSEYPPAPPALLATVNRSQSFSQFCYREQGLKSDPRLSGGVAMLVTISASGVSRATVGNSNWSSGAAGRAVNTCLNEGARRAWKLNPGEVKPGTYVVPLSFSGG